MRARLPLPGIAIVLLTSAGAWSLAPDDWRTAYARGVEALDHGEPRDAVAHFEIAVARAPRNPQALHGLLVAQLTAARTAKACETARTLLAVLRSASPDFDIAMAAGQTLARHGQLPQAIDFFQLARAHAPPQIDGRGSSAYFDNLFAALFSQTRETEKALSHLEQLIESDPRNPIYAYQLGLLRIQAARFDQAYSGLEAALKQFPESFEVRLAYALSCYFSGRNPQAEESYRRLVRMRPNSDQPYFALGNFYADTGRDSDAAQAFGQAARLGPGQYLNQYMYGVELYRTQKLPLAEERLRRAVELNARHADSRYWLAKIYLARDRRDLAERELETAVRLEPKHIGAYYQLALLYQRRGEKEKAGKALQVRAGLISELHRGIVAERMTPGP